MTEHINPAAPHPLSTEDVNLLIETQLECWTMAKENFFRLGDCRRRPMRWGALEGATQLNPARIRSTGAAVDARSISERPCFLCAANRPAEQISIPWMEGWELLVNPFPILPVHFTVVSATHRPQDEIPPEMASMAEAAPSLAFFFNGARAGASAPDHMHVQAVLRNELPLLRLAEGMLPADAEYILFSDEYDGEGSVSREEAAALPFHFVTATVTPDRAGMARFAAMLRVKGLDRAAGRLDAGLVNAFFWIDAKGLLRILVVPRSAHRPACWGAEEGERLVVSPGAIDMAGLMIVPRPEDFGKIDADTARRIYAEVAFADAIPDEIKDETMRPDGIRG